MIVCFKNRHVVTFSSSSINLSDTFRNVNYIRYQHGHRAAKVTNQSYRPLSCVIFIDYNNIKFRYVTRLLGLEDQEGQF